MPHGVHPFQQNTSPSVVALHRQAGMPEQVPHDTFTKGTHVNPQTAGDVDANAGVPRLVSTGAVQAIAAPAPMRFRIFRREISFLGSSSDTDSPPSTPEVTFSQVQGR